MPPLGSAVEYAITGEIAQPVSPHGTALLRPSTKIKTKQKFAETRELNVLKIYYNLKIYKKMAPDSEYVRVLCISKVRIW